MTNEELVIKIKAGDDVANNMLQLWQQCRRYIYMIALKYQGTADIEDLEQEGYLSLYDAVEGFQPERGYKFLTYADFWITRKMVRYIQKNRSIRIPDYESQKINEYKKIVNTYYIRNGKKITRKEVSKVLNMTVPEVIKLEKSMLMSKVDSTDKPVSDETDRITSGELVASETDIENEVLESVQQEQLKRIIWPFVEELPQKQRQVLEGRYKENVTLKCIGERLGMTQEQVRQTENKALRSLKCSKNCRVLRSFVDETVEKGMYRHNGVHEFNRTWYSSTELAALKGIE